MPPTLAARLRRVIGSEKNRHAFHLVNDPRPKYDCSHGAAAT
jgi:hypothetical protein